MRLTRRANSFGSRRETSIPRVSRFRFRCLLHMERELQMLAQQSRASALPSTKPRARVSNRLRIRLFRFRACPPHHRERKLVSLTFAVASLAIPRFLASSACPRFNGGSWMLLMESSNRRGAMVGAGDAGHINSMVIKTASFMA